MADHLRTDLVLDSVGMAITSQKPAASRAILPERAAGVVPSIRTAMSGGQRSGP